MNKGEFNSLQIGNEGEGHARPFHTAYPRDISRQGQRIGVD